MESTHFSQPDGVAGYAVGLSEKVVEPICIPVVIVPVHGLKVDGALSAIAVELRQPGQSSVGDRRSTNLNLACVRLHPLHIACSGICGRDVGLSVQVRLIEAQDVRRSVCDGGLHSLIPGVGEARPETPEHRDVLQIGVRTFAHLTPVVVPAYLGVGGGEEVCVCAAVIA